MLTTQELPHLYRSPAHAARAAKEVHRRYGTRCQTLPPNGPPYLHRLRLTGAPERIRAAVGATGADDFAEASDAISEGEAKRFELLGNSALFPDEPAAQSALDAITETFEASGAVVRCGPSLAAFGLALYAPPGADDAAIREAAELHPSSISPREARARAGVKSGAWLLSCP